jgi:hypothetical protein
MENLEKLIKIQSILKLSAQTTPTPSDNELLEYIDVLIAIEKEYV